MKRLFFAAWPDEITRRQCASVIENIPGDLARPVKLNNLHVTLLFLGSIDAMQEQAISAAAAALSPPCMSLTFDQLEFWQKPGILCLTCSGFDQQLVTFVERLAVIAAENGVSIDERSYKPHITLARKARELAVLKLQPILWRIEGFCLAESCSTPDGVEYKVVRRWG